MNLCVLMGGNSNEREVSLFSGQELLKHLDKNKYKIKTIEIPEGKSTDWIQTLLDHPPDIVLSALHGGLGENGAIQGLLECMHIPYVGSGVMSSAICLNKYMSKTLMRAHHIPVAPDVHIKQLPELLVYEDNILNEIGFPLITKPNMGGSSIDISIVETKEGLEPAVKQILSTGDTVLVEKYINGQEVTVGITEDEKGLNVMPVLDINPSDTFYDYRSKYFDETTRIDFSGLPEFLKTMIQEIAKKTYLLLDCHGYGRVDMMVHEEQVIVLEMNTLPGLTSHSLIPKAASDRAGGFSKFLDGLISFELAQNKR